jgi:hypothetical protein
MEQEVPAIQLPLPNHNLSFSEIVVIAAEYSEHAEIVEWDVATQVDLSNRYPGLLRGYYWQQGTIKETVVDSVDDQQLQQQLEEEEKQVQTLTQWSLYQHLLMTLRPEYEAVTTAISHSLVGRGF